MSKGNTTENDLLAYIFTGTALPWGSETNLKIHLHTADPGEAGVSTTSECAYGSYAAQVVSRSGSGWTVTGNSCANDALIQFPQCSSGTETITHVSISPETTTQILYSGALNASVAVSSGIQPQFAISALTITED